MTTLIIALLGIAAVTFFIFKQKADKPVKIDPKIETPEEKAPAQANPPVTAAPTATAAKPTTAGPTGTSKPSAGGNSGKQGGQKKKPTGK